MLARDWPKRVTWPNIPIFLRQMATIVYLYNNQINARAVIGQSAVGYCAGKPTEKSRVLWIII